MNSLERPIFLFSSGRSGSTWLQRILNIHPHITIWGEHYGFLSGISNAYFNIKNSTYGMMEEKREDAAANKRLLIGPLTDHTLHTEWIGAFSKQEFKSKLRSFLTNLFAEGLATNIRWGFKEIRYINNDVARMLFELYPHSKFIFMERNDVDVIRSMLLAWQNNESWNRLTEKQKSEKIVNIYEQKFKQRHEFEIFTTSVTTPNTTLTTTYEGLVDNFDNTVKTLFEFLDEDFDLLDKNTLSLVNQTKVYNTRSDDEIEAMIRKTLDFHHNKKTHIQS